jgi:hypothetical protein
VSFGRHSAAAALPHRVKREKFPFPLRARMREWPAVVVKVCRSGTKESCEGKKRDDFMALL